MHRRHGDLRRLAAKVVQRLIAASSPVIICGACRAWSTNCTSPWESMPEYKLMPAFSARRERTLSGTAPTPSWTHAWSGISSST